jgi:hypothetical protein
VIVSVIVSEQQNESFWLDTSVPSTFCFSLKRNKQILILLLTFLH